MPHASTDLDGRESLAGVVITYGTFDLFHIGHLRLLQRAADLGSELHVGVSTDGFNRVKGKDCRTAYAERRAIVTGQTMVTSTFAEENWDQKPHDIARLGATIFVMGDDWTGKFDHLGALCRVVYLPRTPDISSTMLRRLTARRSGGGASRAGPEHD